jgi:tetratricopeptide (TPR) repeat protein
VSCIRNICLVLAVLLATSTAGAAEPKDTLAAKDTDTTQEPSEEQRAVALKKYKQGTKAFAASRYKDAADLFLQADNIVQRPAFAYNASLAFDNLRDSENALRWAREYLRRSPDAKNAAEMKGNIRRYEKHLQTKGIQQLTIVSTPAAATVLVDERAVGVTPWTGELVPGHHTATLRLPGYEEHQEGLVLPADHAIDVSFGLTKSNEAVPDAAPPREVPADGDTASEGSAALLALSVVTIIVGAGALGAAGGLEAARASAEQDAIDEPIQTDAAQHLADADDFQIGARVLIGVGAGLMVAGTIMLIVDLSSDSDAEEQAQLRIGCQGACGLQLSGSF